MTLGLVVVIALAVVFDYINGFHDTANAIATSVATRALRPQYALRWVELDADLALPPWSCWFATAHR